MNRIFDVRFMCVTLVILVTVSTASTTSPPSDEQLQQAIDDYHQKWEALFERGNVAREAIDELRSHALDGLPVSELTPRQAGMLLHANMVHGEENRRAILDHMTALKDDQSTIGAAARLLRLYFIGRVSGPHNPPGAELQEKLLGEVFAHPALSQAIRSGEAAIVIKVLRSLGKKSVWRPYKSEIYALADDIVQCKDHRIAFRLEDYFDILGYINDGTEVDEQRRQSIRAKLVAYARSVLARSDAGEIDMTGDDRKWLEGPIAQLDSAHARGELIGSEAPALDFIWSNDESLTSLAALRGRVVILDFWATWCGPCVASIPNVRELHARYEGFPVKIIGVTSIQGAHYGADGEVDCKDDPEKEMKLMAEYISEKDITWTIAFTKQEVFNPEYGVRGIPHMTVIAPDGTVRHNDLHPANPLTEKAAKIDALVEEFDLPTPPPLD